MGLVNSSSDVAVAGGQKLPWHQQQEHWRSTQCRSDGCAAVTVGMAVAVAHGPVCSASDSCGVLANGWIAAVAAVQPRRWLVHTAASRC